MGNSTMVGLTSDQAAVYRLIKKFVERQKIVFDAMMELHPVLMARSGMISEEQLKEILKTRGDRHISGVGNWGEANEWQYFLHGAGCHLIHKSTGEPIEWDAPNVKRFDRNWFENWVEWASKQEHDRETVSTIRSLGSLDRERLRELIYSILSQLVDSKMLVLADPSSNKYLLV